MFVSLHTVGGAGVCCTGTSTAAGEVEKEKNHSLGFVSCVLLWHSPTKLLVLGTR